MKKKILTSVILFAFSSTFVIGLYKISEKINHHSNNFIRLFPPHIALLSKITDIRYNSYYIAGATAKEIYLGNNTAPLHVLKTDRAFSDTQHLTISFIHAPKLSATLLTIDSPYFYLSDFNTHSIYRGQMETLSANEKIQDNLFFDEAVPISGNTLALRAIKKDALEYTLGKKNLYPSFFRSNPDLLEKQIDGIFSTDGILNYEPAKHILVYTYYYRNQYICMDTNLNLIYRGKTIDTTSVAKIKLGKINSENQVTFSAPPLMVNKYCSVTGDNLFINSTLRAKNENEKSAEGTSVIDVYDLKKGIYRFSFYISGYADYKLKSFRVFQHKFIGIFDHYLISYDLNPEYF